MLEWLEDRLDVGCDKRLVYEYRIEPLKCDRDALKQECRLARIAGSGTQPPTHLSEKIQRARSYILPPEFRGRLLLLLLMLLLQSNIAVCCDYCSLYDSDVSQDWYSPSYSPPDHAYTPTGDVTDHVPDYPSDYDYSYDDWSYDNRPRGTGRKLPAPPPTSAEYSWQPPTSTVNGADYVAPGDGQQSRLQPSDAAPPPMFNGYITDDLHRDYDYADYNGYYDAGDDYYDGSDGYDRTSDMYDDRYYMSFDGGYGDALVNGYVDGYTEADMRQPAYYEYNDMPYGDDYQQSSQYDGTERGTDVDQQSTQYPLSPVVPSSSPAVQVGDVDRRTPHDAIYDDGYVDRDGIYHHYDNRRYDDERYYTSGAKYVASIPSDAGESAYDVDELAEVMSSVPARSSIDSSATPAPAVRYDRYYDVKTDSFESYDRDSTTFDATAGMKDSGYQTFNHQQSVPSEPEPPYFSHVDANSWQPPTVNGDVRRSPVTIIDAQVPRQSFLISHPADNTFAPSADQRWPGSVPPVSDGLPSAPAPSGFSDAMIPTSSMDSTSIGSATDVATVYCVL